MGLEAAKVDDLVNRLRNVTFKAFAPTCGDLREELDSQAAANPVYQRLQEEHKTRWSDWTPNGRDSWQMPRSKEDRESLAYHLFRLVAERDDSGSALLLLRMYHTGIQWTPTQITSRFPANVDAFRADFLDYLADALKRILAAEPTIHVAFSLAPSAPVVAPKEGDLAVPETSDDSYDIAIVCALHEKELDSVLKLGETAWRLHHVEGDPSSYHKTTFARKTGAPLRVIAAAAPHMGMPASAVLATKMILHFRPSLVAMVGLAAGIDSEKQGFGDILAPDTTFDYASGKLSPAGDGLKLRPDAKPLAIEARLAARLLDWKRERRHLDAIRQAWHSDKPKTALDVHVGPLGSGPAVLESTKPLSDVVEHWRKLIGIEMEAHGVHLACHNAMTPKPWFLCMKAICDFAENKTDTWQTYAAFTSAQLFHRFVGEEWDTLALPSPTRRLPTGQTPSSPTIPVVEPTPSPAIIDHDKEIFRISNDILPEQTLRSLLDRLSADHSYSRRQQECIAQFLSYFDLESNSYVIQRLNLSAEELRIALMTLDEYIAKHFFVYPNNQPSGHPDGTRFCMYPEFNVDRGGNGSREQLEHYDQHSRALQDVIDKTRQAYAEYRKTVKTLLVV